MTKTLCSVDRASLYNLVNGTNLVHSLFSVYFVSFIYNLYMFRTSLGPSSGGTIVFMRHLVLLCICKQHSLFYTFYDIRFYNFKLSTCFRINSTKCRINTVVPPDDGPG